MKSLFSHISSATAFGWGLGSIALAAFHGFASAVGVSKGGSAPKCDCTSTRSQSHGKPLVQCSLALSQTLWPKKYAKKTFHRLKSFFWLSGRSGYAPFKSCGEKTFPITRKAMAHWATLTLSQMPWGHSNMSECVRKNFSQAEKFFSTRLKRSIASATRQPEKTFQLLKSVFWPFPIEKVSKKTHLVASELVKSTR